MRKTDQGLLDTVVTLMNFGFAGVGVIVLLLVFIILMRGNPADEPTQALRRSFLVWGMSFAFFCGVMAIAVPLFAPAPGPPPRMLLSFSPSFETEQLPDPVITLPDGTRIAPRIQFDAQRGQILVSVDSALNQIASLKEATAVLAEAAGDAQKQADEAVEALAEAQRQVAAAGAAPASAARESTVARREAEQASRQAQQTAADIAKTVESGASVSDIVARTERLRTYSMTSSRARTQAIRTATPSN